MAISTFEKYTTEEEKTLTTHTQISQRDPSHTTSKNLSVRADGSPPSPPLRRSTTRTQGKTPSLGSKMSIELHPINNKLNEKLQIDEELEERARNQPSCAFTTTTSTDLQNEIHLCRTLKSTPCPSEPRHLVETPGKDHLPPDLSPLEVDLGFRRAISLQSCKHIDGQERTRKEK
ncbi:hypothetical protein Bca101_011039 [Brassica carinata]